MGKTFLLAPDSFKESMTAKEVCVAMEAGIKRAIPDAECIHVPMADGGEGTVQSLVDATGGTLVTKEVTGPLHTPVLAQYGILGEVRLLSLKWHLQAESIMLTKKQKIPLLPQLLEQGN